MNNRIPDCLEQLNSKGRKALVTYLVAGDPDLETTLEAMHQMVKSGVNLIELGVPFSDPAAEGPTIQRSHERALDNHVGLTTVFELLQKFRQQDPDTPVILMGYANPIEWMGLESFAQRAAQAGADGVLTVDLPPEEAVDYQKAYEKAGLVSIFLVAPTTQPARIKQIADLANGFIYYVSLKGVTGSSKLDASELEERLQLLRQYSSLPVCVGFGIKTAEDAVKVASVADGVVIGSSIVELLDTTPKAERMNALAGYLSEIRNAID